MGRTPLPLRERTYSICLEMPNQLFVLYQCSVDFPAAPSRGLTEHNGAGAVADRAGWGFRANVNTIPG
jgi:hypothetical protein